MIQWRKRQIISKQNMWQSNSKRKQCNLFNQNLQFLQQEVFLVLLWILLAWHSCPTLISWFLCLQFDRELKMSPYCVQSVAMMETRQFSSEKGISPYLSQNYLLESLP